MADLTYAQAKALIQSDPLNELVAAFAMLLSGNRPDGTVIDTVGASSGTADTQYADGGSAVTNGTGTAPIWFDGSGVPQDVRPTTPLPQTRYTSAGVEIGLPANPDTVQGPIPPGSSASGTRPVLTGGSDGTNARTFKTETDGTLDTFNTAALNAIDDRVSSVVDTASVGNAGTLLTPKFAKIDIATSGASNTVVAAVTSKKIRVLSYNFVCAGAVTFQWFTAASASLSGAKSFAANGGMVAPFSPLGHIETVAGEALKVTLGGAIQVSGELTYVEV